MEFLIWFSIGLVISCLFLYLSWWKGEDIVPSDVVILITGIIAGPFAIMFFVILFFIWLITLVEDNIDNGILIRGRKNTKKDSFYG